MAVSQNRLERLLRPDAESFYRAGPGEEPIPGRLRVESRALGDYVFVPRTGPRIFLNCASVSLEGDTINA